MSVDFRARAAAKQAWLKRRSEPRRGLLLGLIAGSAIGCLGAFAVLSFIPGEMGATASGVMSSVSPPAGAATARLRKDLTENNTAPGPVLASTVSVPIAPVAVAPPRSEPTRADTVGSEVSTNLVPPVTAADPPVTRSLRSEPPVLAQGAGAKQKARAIKKKKKVIVDRRKPPRLHHWPGERRPRLNDWAYRNNFSFGGGYYGW